MMKPLKARIDLLQAPLDKLSEALKLSSREDVGEIDVRKRDFRKRGSTINIPSFESEVEDHKSRPMKRMFQFREDQLDRKEGLNRMNDERSWIFDQDEGIVGCSRRKSESTTRWKMLVRL